MTQKVHYRLTSVAQKHSCLSSLLRIDGEWVIYDDDVIM